jgi:hypothetical protein
LVGLGLGLLTTLIGAGLVILAAGAGHGTYAPAKLLFPFAMLLAVAARTIDLPSLILAGLQFPLYGIILGSVSSSRMRSVASAFGVIHLIAMAVVFAIPDQSFS